MQRGKIIYDVKLAYYGYLSAHNGVLFLTDVKKRVDKALASTEAWLEADEGKATQSDLYALQAASSLIKSYIVKTEALEKIALDGVKVLVGMNLVDALELADSSLVAVELPNDELLKLQARALKERPEIIQLQHGLEARRALVKAKKSLKKPNLYAGLAGMLSFSPLRDRVDNPHIADPFNDVGTTPIVGVKWDWAGGVQDAQARQEQAELNALIQKNSLAQKGIPYQVFEAFTQANAHYQAVQALESSAKAARRWMISRYTEYEAGLEPVDKMVSAFQAYILSYTDYLKTVYDYNMQVAQLEQVVGDYQ